MPVGGAISTAQAQAFLGHLHQVREETFQTEETQAAVDAAALLCSMFSLFVKDEESFIRTYIWLHHLVKERGWQKVLIVALTSLH